MKRYQFGSRYSDVTVTGGQPKAIGEANFDIISPFRSMASEAELLGLVDKVITEFRGFSTYNFQLHVSHHILLDVLLEAVPAHARQDVKMVLAELGTHFSAHAARHRITEIVRLGKQILDDIEACLVVGESTLTSIAAVLICRSSCGRD